MKEVNESEKTTTYQSWFSYGYSNLLCGILKIEGLD